MSNQADRKRFKGRELNHKNVVRRRSCASAVNGVQACGHVSISSICSVPESLVLSIRIRLTESGSWGDSGGNTAVNWFTIFPAPTDSAMDICRQSKRR